MSVRVDVCAQTSVSMDKYVNMCECVFMFVSALKLPRVAIHLGDDLGYSKGNN